MASLRVVTVEREFGCGSTAIAAHLACRLGWKLWDGSLTDEVARVARVSRDCVAAREERVDPLVHRLSKVFMRGSFERRIALDGLEVFDAERMVAVFEQVIRKAAEAGPCVIVGRGAPYFLRHHRNAYHVFIYAPAEEKLRRLCAIGRSEAEAEELIKEVDRDRALFVKRFFGKDWPCRSSYHMMINSAVGDEAVIDTILHAMAQLETKP